MIYAICIAIYYLIGVLVSIYFMYYYRLSKKTKSAPHKTDAIGGLLVPWTWPVQIGLHFYARNKYKNNGSN